MIYPSWDKDQTLSCFAGIMLAIMSACGHAWFAVVFLAVAVSVVCLLYAHPLQKLKGFFVGVTSKSELFPEKVPMVRVYSSGWIDGRDSPDASDSWLRTFSRAFAALESPRLATKKTQNSKMSDLQKPEAKKSSVAEDDNSRSRDDMGGSQGCSRGLFAATGTAFKSVSTHGSGSST